MSIRKFDTDEPIIDVRDFYDTYRMVRSPVEYVSYHPQETTLTFCRDDTLEQWIVTNGYEYASGLSPSDALSRLITHCQPQYDPPTINIDNIIGMLYDSWHPSVKMHNGFNQKLTIQLWQSGYHWHVRLFLDTRNGPTDVVEEFDQRLDNAIKKVLQSQQLLSKQVQEGLEWADRPKLGG